MNFKELKKDSKISLKKNHINTVLICVTGMILLSLYSITANTISGALESFSNLFEYGTFLTNTYYEAWQEYKENNKIENEDIIKIEENEEKKSLAEKYRVTDGIFKTLLDFLDNEWQILYDNIASIARNILPRQYHYYY